MRVLLDYSWPLFAVGFFGVLMKSVDTLMLGYISTTYSTGIYSIAMSTANMLTIAENAFGTLFLPVVTGLYAIKHKPALRKTYATVTRWVYSTTFPATLFTVIFAAEILGVMFGDVYAEGAGALSILALGFFLVSACGPVRNMMESIAKTRFILYNTLAAAAINIALNMLLIPLLGMNGAALATLASFFALNALSWIEVYWFLRVQPYSAAFLKPTLAACIAASAFFLIKQFLPPLLPMPFVQSLALLLLLGFSFVAFYAVAFILIGGVQKEDLHVLLSAKKKYGFIPSAAISFIKRFVK